MLHVNKLKTKERMGRIVAGSSLATFLIIFSLLLTSVGGEKVSAADTTTPTLIESFVKDTTVSLELDTSIANTVSLAPTDTVAAMGQINVRTRVGVTHSDGYQISIQANTRDLVSGDNTIPATNVSRTLEQLDENTWGYGFGNTLNGITYQAPPTTSTIIYEGKGKDISENKEFYLSFGTKVNTTLTPGRYTNSILLSVVSEPATVAGFNGITTMQELTPTICAEAEENVTAYLRDTRDNNYYWVTKLADGNCWMSQNLALNLTKGKAIEGSKLENPSSTEASVAYTFIPEATTMTPSTSDRFSSTYADSNNAIYSWNEGKYVVIKPEGAYSVSTYAASTDGGLAAFADATFLDAKKVPTESTDPTSSRVTYIMDGKQYDGVVADVSGSDWEVAKDPNFTASTQVTTSTGKTCNKTAGWAISPECKVYDAHYLVGNYYQWLAAAIQIPTTQSGYTSICPKGWRLPRSASTSANGSFPAMLEQYNLLRVTLPSGSNATNNIASAPLFFTRSGFMGKYNSVNIVPSSVGNQGYYWTLDQYSNTQAMYMGFTYRAVTSSSAYVDRFWGMSVRCLVRSSTN